MLCPFSIIPMSTAAAWSLHSVPKTIWNEPLFFKTTNNQILQNKGVANKRWKQSMPLRSSKDEDGEDMDFHRLSNTLNEIEEEFSQIMMEDEEVHPKGNDDDEIIDISHELKEFKNDYFNQQHESQKKDKKKKQKTNRSKREIKTYTHILHQQVEELLQKGLVDEAVQKAEDNIETLQSLHWETGIRWYKPTIHTYNVYIRAVSQKQPDGPQRAELILKTLPIPPNVGTYTIVISALASAHAYPSNDYKNKKKNSNAADKAQTLLYELMDLMQQQDQDSKSTESKLQGLEQNEDEEDDDYKDIEGDQKRDAFIPEGDLSVACDAGKFFFLLSITNFFSILKSVNLFTIFQSFLYTQWFVLSKLNF